MNTMLLLTTTLQILLGYYLLSLISWLGLRAVAAIRPLTGKAAAVLPHLQAIAWIPVEPFRALAASTVALVKALVARA